MRVPSWCVLLVLAVPAAAETSPGTTTFEESTLKITGNRTTTVRYQHYTGLDSRASALFQSGFTRHETTRLKVSGQALETVKIEGEIFQSDVDFDNRYRLRLATRNYELFLGEFAAGFEGSEFTLFRRQLQGARLTGEVPLHDGGALAPALSFTMIASSPRGAKKYEKFFGTDTQGPYRLGSIPVVLDSEQVMVDKVPQARNVDYEINYITGTLTFKRRIVETRSLVEVTYEARSTVYPRALYGGQVKYRFTDYDAASLIVLDERDRKDAGTFAFSGVPATAHSVLGGTYEHDGEFLRYGGEYAHSFYDPDRFTRGLDGGDAYKGRLELERYGLLLGGDVKKTGPQFRSLGNTTLGRDFLGWSGYGGLGIGRVVKVTGKHQQHDTVLQDPLGRDVSNRLVATDAKAVLSPKGWPVETYRFFQGEETFGTSYDRLERRHTADLRHAFKHLTIGAGYERDDITFRDASRPDRRWDAGKAGVGVSGVSWLALSANGEVRRGVESGTVFAAARSFETVLASANVGFRPHERYAVNASNNWQDTTGRPAQNTLRTEARAKPVDRISGQASFSQETLQMFYVGAPHAARTDSYGGLVEVQPLATLALLYQPSLRETVLSGLAPPVNANRREAWTAKWALGSLASLEGNYRIEAFRLRDANDPALRLSTSEDADEWDASLRFTPVAAVSADLGYADRTGSKAQLNALGVYDGRTSRRQTARVGVRPQLEAKLGLDGGYTFEQFRQAGSQGAATSLPGYSLSPLDERIVAFTLLNDFTRMHTHRHTARGGASYQWVKALISTAGVTYDLQQDRLGVISDTETLAVQSGLTYRIRALKVEGTYRLARSRGGADTLQQSFSGGLDVTPAEQVRWTTRAEYVASERPARASTDVTSSLEVSF